jgi:hypothetical protein
MIINGPIGSIDGLHEDCRWCVGGWCHSGCNESFLTDSTLRGVYVLVLDAARGGDATTVASFAPALAGFVVVNRERNAVQVFSCSQRAVIASLPLPRSVEDGVSLLMSSAVPLPTMARANTAGRRVP